MMNLNTPMLSLKNLIQIFGEKMTIMKKLMIKKLILMILFQEELNNSIINHSTCMLDLILTPLVEKVFSDLL